MDIKSIEKRHKSKLVLIFAFEVFLLGIGFLTYSHMKDDPSFTFLSITNIKFLVPFAVALCGFGIKFKNYFLVKFPVILIIFMVLFLFSGKFSFLYSRNTIFFISFNFYIINCDWIILYNFISHCRTILFRKISRF